MDVNSIGPVNGGQPVRPAARSAAPQGPAEARPVSPTDELELNSVNSPAGEVDMQAEFRAQRIAAIQQQIAEGTYETDEKLNLAVDRMLESLLAE